MSEKNVKFFLIFQKYFIKYFTPKKFEKYYITINKSTRIKPGKTSSLLIPSQLLSRDARSASAVLLS